MAKHIRLHDRSTVNVAGDTRLGKTNGFIGPETERMRHSASSYFCADANNGMKFSQSAKRKHEEPNPICKICP